MARRMKGEGAVYQRPSDGLWVAQLDLGYVNGTRKRRTVYAHSQAEATRRLRDARKEMEAGRISTDSATVERWLRHWLDEIAAKKVKPRTLTTYRSYVEQHLIPALGRKRLDRLAPQHVRELHRAVLDTGHTSTTAMHAHRILSTALGAAVREQVIVRNVARLVEAPRRDRNTRRGLTVAQARNVLDAAGDGPMAARWWAALLTGARQGECLGLRWDYLDLDAGLADIAWSLQRVPYTHGCGDRKADRTWPCGHRWGSGCPHRRIVLPPGMEHERLDGNLCLLRPKTKGSRRIVPLLPAMVAALRLHRASDTGPNPHGLVWHRDDGRPLDAGVDWRAWTELLDGAKVPHVTLHEARNTTATLLLELGVDAAVIREILGHSDIATTRGYQKVSVELARKAIARLGELLAIE